MLLMSPWKGSRVMFKTNKTQDWLISQLENKWKEHIEIARISTRGRLVKEKVRRAELKECHKEHLKAARCQLVEKNGKCPRKKR